MKYNELTALVKGALNIAPPDTGVHVARKMRCIERH